MCLTEAGMPLESETQTYEQHREALLGTAQGKFALIHGTEVAGVYDSKSDAIRDGYRRFGNVPFFVKPILAGEVPQNLAPQLLGVSPRPLPRAGSEPARDGARRA